MALPPASWTNCARARRWRRWSGGGCGWPGRGGSGRAAARSTARRPRASTSMRTATTTASAAARTATRSASSCRAEGAGFMEAVEQLAAEAGLEVPKPSPEAAEAERKRLDLRRGAGGCAGQLPAAAVPARRPPRAGLSARPRSDRSRRSATSASAGRARAAARWRRTSGRDGITQDQLVDAGLMRRDDETGRAFDLFFNRVMFPIRDRRGRVISFGGRILGDGQPKYVNGPETALFSKRRTLYALDLGARGGARRRAAGGGRRLYGRDRPGAGRHRRRRRPARARR